MTTPPVLPVPRPPPGDVLLRWPALIALVVLVCNDHWWKGAYGGWLTGKLSGVAALVLAPLVVVAVIELVVGPRVPRRRTLVAALTGVGLAAAMALVETTAGGEQAYEMTLGWLQWPPRAIVAFVFGTGWPDAQPVVQHRDITDLLTLPAAAVPAWWLRASAASD